MPYMHEHHECQDDGRTGRLLAAGYSGKGGTTSLVRRGDGCHEVRHNGVLVGEWNSPDMARDQAKRLAWGQLKGGADGE